MDLFRRFLQGVRVAPSDEELGRRSSVYPSEPRKSVPNPDEAPSAVLESSDKLMEFRMLIGSEYQCLMISNALPYEPDHITSNYSPIIQVTERI